MKIGVIGQGFVGSAITSTDVVSILGSAANPVYNVTISDCEFIGQNKEINVGNVNIQDYCYDVTIENCSAYNGALFNYQIY
jgi:hypothetical protein